MQKKFSLTITPLYKNVVLSIKRNISIDKADYGVYRTMILQGTEIKRVTTWNNFEKNAKNPEYGDFFTVRNRQH